MLVALATFACSALVCGRLLAADTTGWTRYHAFGGRLQFSYPADLLKINSDGVRVTLHHSVPYRHDDPCEFEGDGRSLDGFLDMALSFTFDERPLLDAIRARQSFAVVDDSIRADGRAQFDGLYGVRIQAAVENCGVQRYYLFTYPPTLIVERSVITLFAWGDVALGKTLRALPGVIVPEQEEDLFNTILATVAIAPLIRDALPPINGSAKQFDHTPPPAPSVRIDGIWRGSGAVMLPDGRTVWGSHSNEASVLAEVAPPNEEADGIRGLRYRIHLIDGELPYGFLRPHFETAVPMKRGWFLRITWDDGATWNQEPFAFRFAVSCVDSAGNESALSDTLVVSHNGDMSAAKEKAQLEFSETIEFVDYPRQTFRGERPRQ